MRHICLKGSHSLFHPFQIFIRFVLPEFTNFTKPLLTSHKQEDCCHLSYYRISMLNTTKQLCKICCAVSCVHQPVHTTLMFCCQKSAYDHINPDAAEECIECVILTLHCSVHVEKPNMWSVRVTILHINMGGGVIIQFGAW